MQLDLFNENKIKEYEKLINSIIYICNHYKSTKAIYNQFEIADYILFLIDEVFNYDKK